MNRIPRSTLLQAAVGALLERAVGRLEPERALVATTGFAQVVDGPKPQTLEWDEELCATCNGSGTIRALTSHLGPDDYEYDEQCPACAGCGSANLKDAIESLPYSQHRVRGVAVIERTAVLRLVEAHLARLKTPNVGGEPETTARTNL